MRRPGRVEEIAATPGFEGIYIGPSDLSLTPGKTPQGREALGDEIARVGEACQA